MRREHTSQDNPTYWQVAAGARGRDYSAQFLRFGMAFVGGEHQIGTMAQVKSGDRIILKRGTSEIVAVGRVVERDGKATGKLDKEWLRDFDGWDLPAYCYVEWHAPATPVATAGLTRATIQKAHRSHLLEVAERTLREVTAYPVIEPEPQATKRVDDKEILEFLIEEGLRPGSADDLTTAFRRIRLLARYYYDQRNWGDIREHETRTFLILPLLLALGWAEQQIKIELPVRGRQRADVACFLRPYRRDDSGKPNDKDCVLILESKGFSQGLDYAPEQAIEYAEHFPDCRVVAVSNGYCYKTFLRGEPGSFQLAPSAYLNLLNPRDRYPIDPEHVEGCLEVLSLLLPSFYVK